MYKNMIAKAGMKPAGRKGMSGRTANQRSAADFGHAFLKCGIAGVCHCAVKVVLRWRERQRLARVRFADGVLVVTIE
jgi:hypothetical protein